MAPAFSDICTLLSRLEDIELRDPPFYPPAEKSRAETAVVESWFKSHSSSIHGLDTETTVGTLSLFLPERRTDRVYGIQSASLCRILGRCLRLGSAQTRDLEAFKQPGRGDLGMCLERVLKAGGPAARPPVTISEIDQVLDELAGGCRFSNPKILALPGGSSRNRDDLLGLVFKRLSAFEGKWMARVLLKDLSPVRINESLILRTFHFLLPDLLQLQNDLGVAIGLLKGPLQEIPQAPDRRSMQLWREKASQLFRPSVGVKVGRPTFYKARSVDHCFKMLGGKPWVLERKYDGEYCEIHIDTTRSAIPAECITIFSKSGKESTMDRKGLHQTLVECLRLGKNSCKIKRRAMLLGELVVFSDKEGRVLPFEQIRKHISRSGTLIGTDQDSPRNAHEHLSIVFFDLLVWDDEMVMNKPVEERRQWLREIYDKVPGGKAFSAEWKVVDFGDTEKAMKALVSQFAASIAERCEGLVLKPCGAPYISLGSAARDYSNSYIKLKKDYMVGLGDEADFAVVAASYDAQRAAKCGIPSVKWTDFHLGCLMNKVDVLRFDARPKYKVVGTIRAAESCIPRDILQTVNILAVFSAEAFNPGTRPSSFDLESGCASNSHVFNVPFVFEVLGSGFERPSNARYFMLRHPRVKKLHQDRTWKDCISMQELQEQAAAARNEPADSESQETKRWIARIGKQCTKKIERGRTLTPRSKTTRTPSTASQASLELSGRHQKGIKFVAHPEVVNQTPIPVFSQSTTSSQALDGTTLVGNDFGHRKRAREEPRVTPCPAAKKQRSHDRGEKVHPCNPPEPSKPKPPPPLKSTPLTDITNTSRPLKPRSTPNPIPKSILTRLNPLPAPKSPSTPPQCPNPTCLLNETTIYHPATLYPFIPRLIATHNALPAHTLAHWSRATHTHPQGTATVSESQSYAGRRKVALVDTAAPAEVRAVVRGVLALNDGKFVERVEVWDCRVLEEGQGCGVGIEEGRAGGRFVGATIWDGGTGRARFVWERGWEGLGMGRTGVVG